VSRGNLHRRCGHNLPCTELPGGGVPRRRSLQCFASWRETTLFCLPSCAGTQNGCLVAFSVGAQRILGLSRPLPTLLETVLDRQSLSEYAVVSQPHTDVTVSHPAREFIQRSIRLEAPEHRISESLTNLQVLKYPGPILIIIWRPSVRAMPSRTRRNIQVQNPDATPVPGYIHWTKRQDHGGRCATATRIGSASGRPASGLRHGVASIGYTIT